MPGIQRANSDLLAGLGCVAVERISNCQDYHLLERTMRCWKSHKPRNTEPLVPAWPAAVRLRKLFFMNSHVPALTRLSDHLHGLQKEMWGKWNCLSGEFSQMWWGTPNMLGTSKLSFRAASIISTSSSCGSVYCIFQICAPSSECSLLIPIMQIFLQRKRPALAS
jgi:hypothetical protein